MRCWVFIYDVIHWARCLLHCLCADGWLFSPANGGKWERVLAYLPKLTISQRSTPKDHLWEEMHCWIFKSTAKWKTNGSKYCESSRIFARLNPTVSDFSNIPYYQSYKCYLCLSCHFVHVIMFTTLSEHLDRFQPSSVGCFDLFSVVY